MRRREFITLLGNAATAWPLAARAQQAERMRRIGVLSGVSASNADAQQRYGILLERLRQLGWMIGHNLHVDTRWAGGNAADALKNAAGLVALAPDVILAVGSLSVQALLQSTSTIPIVFTIVPDPVGAGFVASLSEPGGNATGFMMFEYNLAGKWLELAQRDRADCYARGSHSRPLFPGRNRPVCGDPVRVAVGRGRSRSNQHNKYSPTRAASCGLRTRPKSGPNPFGWS
jgi:hypothetical protein